MLADALSRGRISLGMVQSSLLRVGKTSCGQVVTAENVKPPTFVRGVFIHRRGRWRFCLDPGTDSTYISFFVQHDIQSSSQGEEVQDSRPVLCSLVAETFLVLASSPSGGSPIGAPSTSRPSVAGQRESTPSSVSGSSLDCLESIKAGGE